MSYSVSSHFSLETHQVDITKRFFEAAFDIAVVLISLSKLNPFDDVFKTRPIKGRKKKKREGVISPLP